MQRPNGLRGRHPAVCPGKAVPRRHGHLRQEGRQGRLTLGAVRLHEMIRIIHHKLMPDGGSIQVGATTQGCVVGADGGDFQRRDPQWFIGRIGL